MVMAEAGKVYASEALSPTLSVCGWAGDWGPLVHPLGGSACPWQRRRYLPGLVCPQQGR